MDILGASKTDEYPVYYPEFGGNRDRPEEQRCAISYRPITTQEYLETEHAPLLTTKGLKMDDTLSVLQKRDWAKVCRILEARVVALKNFFQVDPTTKQRRTITAVKDLINCVLASQNVKNLDLIYELYGAVIGSSTLDENLSGE